MRKGMLLAVVLLAGCASMSYQGMSAEQIKAASSDKSFSAVCQTVTGPLGQEKFVYANVDRSVVINGEVTVSPDCIVTMSNDSRAVTAAPVKVTVPMTIVPQVVK